MVKLDLQPNEGIILQRENVRRKMQKGTSLGDLVLTNINIYHASKKGTFRTTYEIAKLPLNQVKMINGQAQAILGGSNVKPSLQIYFKSGQEEFEFENVTFQFQAKKEIITWIENINQILGGEPLETASGKNIMAIPGTKELAGTLKDTVGVFKDTLGVKSKKGTVSENITCKCIGCMAPLSGVKGSTVRCKYCDTEQTL